jgi:hypothetical protein
LGLPSASGEKQPKEISLTWELPGATWVQQGLADLSDRDPRLDPGNGRVEDGHREDAVHSKIGGAIDDRDWDTGGGMIEFGLLQDGDSDSDSDEQLRIWIGNQRQKPWTGSTESRFGDQGSQYGERGTISRLSSRDSRVVPRDRGLEESAGPGGVDWDSKEDSGPTGILPVQQTGETMRTGQALQARKTRKTELA